MRLFLEERFNKCKFVGGEDGPALLIVGFPTNLALWVFLASRALPPTMPHHDAATPFGGTRAHLAQAHGSALGRCKYGARRQRQRTEGSASYAELVATLSVRVRDVPFALRCGVHSIPARVFLFHLRNSVITDCVYNCT